MLHDISLLITLGFLVLLLLIFARIQVYITSTKYNNLIDDYNKLMHNYKIAKNHIKELQQLLRYQYINNQFNNTFIRSSDTTINNDIIQDALKIAMIQSHPDNGGNEDDFIRFREAYNKYKK